MMSVQAATACPWMGVFTVYPSHRADDVNGDRCGIPTYAPCNVLGDAIRAVTIYLHTADM